ncbi:MAG: DNA cytosine methyltransferase [Dysosmobacter sp.]|uniref:DNA cytosine methyltransferase n=1 Tax=uncultured Oscillibacter sp. TaxID=876091 RepID=UPI002608DFFE|nr:DNA cytosine methyltransferase [uncultured Oscillibacter sp.]MCX4373281.1 DNA cytosine methyltransferase [Dysosmobacter sp.]
MYEITLGSLFDGIGGFPYAASFYGIRPLWASEIVPSCVSVTKKFFPDMAHVGDVTRLDGAKLPPVDIITFGSPCQGLSLAGQRRGLADERSGLFLEAIRIIFEMREATHGRYPRFVLFENVPGALSSAGGRDYQIVLQSFTKAEVPVPRSGKWADAGMVRGGGVDLAWCVYDAQYFGTAQRRRRLFLVADFGGKCAGEILFVPKSLRRYFEAGGTPRQGFTAFAENSVGAAGGAVEILNDQGGSSLTVERSGLSPTLRSQTHGNLPIVAGMLCMGTSQANASILSDQSPTLTCAHGQAPILVHPQIAGTLCASGAGLNRPAGIKSETDLCVVKAGIPKAYSIGAYYSKGMLSANPAAGIREASTSRTLDLNGGNPACQQGGIAVVGGNLEGMELIVRRLLPIEAERLMGFPDFWTESGLDGKPISDTQRYSMLGNSIAVPCGAYIMQGIRQAMEAV